jgi:four helix bundle protein
MTDAPTGRQAPAADTPASAVSSSTFGGERLDCYRVALEFQLFAATLIRRGHFRLRDQLDRASVSIALNVAEAQGRYSPDEKAHFFAVARGSATECAALVDILVARGLATATEGRHARGLLLRLVQMLTRLITHWREVGTR